MTSTQPHSAPAAALDAIANELLTVIEGREVRSLAWGFTDIRLDLERDIDEFLWELPEPFARSWAEHRSSGVEPGALLNDLIERKLIFASSGFYRSRFAETIRLLSLLRQRFSDDDWNTGPTLVADYRLALRRRRYPRRDVPADTVLARLGDLGLEPRVVTAVAALLGDGRGGTLSLAAFQAEAIERVLRNQTMKRERGVVIGAGTGSGKTKAFYIPALAEVASTLSAARHVQLLALYPRNELLKDQFVEAFTEARKLDATLRAAKTRPIAIGAYYGDTPYSAASLEWSLIDDKTHQFWDYDERHKAWLCPSLRCPTPACGREALLWARTDVQAEQVANAAHSYGTHERLRCPDCGFETPPGTVHLTRESMLASPPDLLFTSTESLNRNLANAKAHTLFGINVERPPRLMLLDEIHTYAGIAGAQVAYLLRRWRHGRTLQRDPGCTVVGLSATLTQAEQFFADLTGIPEYAVEYVAPAKDDMVEEGAEYNVVLKGDASSGTSLLSTSVQTTMLLGRVLDPLPRRGQPSLSQGAIGQRMFAFTDSLDVINRWFHIASDAETTQRLSKFRQDNKTWPPDHRRQRRAAGQVWGISEALGHNLGQGLRLERTSSQDRGVDRAAQLVIATSTLEVGFNDPTIGAVVQHKAPRNIASFLQRKGRSGRVRGMRPWTVVVTSAFGRDRWAFQHAEQLFDPILPPNYLPLDNDYVRKIQASFALMDWLTLVLASQNVRVNAWELLTNHRARGPQARKGLADNRARVAGILQRVLDGELAEPLSAHLADALNLPPDSAALRGVLWNDPRSLMLDLIPTLLRQVGSNWRTVDGGDWDDTPSSHPIPHYVPNALFADLNLPQLEIAVPYPARYGKPETVGTEFMSISAGMREFAPGHARKRFTERDRAKLAHWLPVHPPKSNDKTVFELQGSGVTTTTRPIAVIPATGGDLPVYKPLRYELEMLPNSVELSSSGWLRWQVRHEAHDAFSTAGGGERTPAIALRPGSPLKTFISAMHAFVHDEGAWARVIRYAPGVDMVFTEKRRKGVPRSAVFHHAGQEVAIGFAIDADAIRFQTKPLDVDDLRARAAWPRLYRSLGARFFRDRLLGDPRLVEENVSSWDVDWLWQVEVAAITAIAVARTCSLEDAAQELDAKRRAIVDRTLKTIFQAQQDESGTELEEYGRRYTELTAIEERGTVVAALREHRAALWDDDLPGLRDWLAERHQASVAAALMTTITRFVPDVNPDDLHVDVSGLDIWISEATPGGVGIVSRIVSQLHGHPRQFDLAFLDAIQSCEREHLSTQLHQISRALQSPDHALAGLFRTARQGGDLVSIDRLIRELAATLEAEGIATSRSLFVALNSKLLRPNSGPESDAVIAQLVKLWVDEAERLRVHIDLRTISVVAATIEVTSDALDRLLDRVGFTDATANQKFNLLQSVLWDGCVDSCPACIQVGHLYADAGYVSRHLLAAQLESVFDHVTFGAPEWETHLRDHLVRHLEVRLVCAQDRLDACTAAVLAFLVEPIDLDFQLAYAAIDRITRDGTTWVLHLVIPDLIGR